jgi:S-formylglutathione hydrolase FrmB
MEVSDPRYEHDGLRHVTVFSRALGRRADCTLWAPPGASGPLPLVVLLHGVYASHWAWSASGGAHVAAAGLIESGAAPFALAMPSDGLFGHGSGYLDQPTGGYERWIIEEVPLLASLVIGTDPAAPLGLVGLSMGGFGALSIGARHGGRVAAAAGMSSITDFDQMALFV